MSSRAEVPATFWARALASVIDGFIVTCGGWIAFFIGYGAYSWGRYFLGGDPFSFAEWVRVDQITSFQVQVTESAIELVLYLAYYTYFHHRTADTPGKRIFRLKVVLASGEKSLSLKRSFARACCYILSYLPFGTGFIMAAFHPEKLALHDLITGTRVVRIG